MYKGLNIVYNLNQQQPSNQCTPLSLSFFSEFSGVLSAAVEDCAPAAVASSYKHRSLISKFNMFTESEA